MNDGNGRWAHSVVQVLAVQQIANRLRLGPQLAPVLLEFRHRAAVTPPQHHDRRHQDEAYAAPHDVRHAVEREATVGEEYRVKQQEPDGEGRQGAAGRAGGGAHDQCTG